MTEGRAVMSREDGAGGSHVLSSGSAEIKTPIRNLRGGEEETIRHEDGMSWTHQAGM